MKTNFKLWRGLVVLCFVLTAVSGSAQDDRNCYIKSYGGLFLCEGSGGKAQLQGAGQAVKYYMTPAYRNYYFIIKESGGERKYLNLSGCELVFGSDNTTTKSHFLIEDGEGGYSLLKCRSNGKYAGTDGTRAGSAVFGDKDGKSSKHVWYLTESADAVPETMKVEYELDAEALRQVHEGWGVSLCWWANMCGKWSDDKIDRIIDWLVSPKGLNYSVFRYNIGGGDDPQNRNCDPHHFGSGKGLRAEMEGFKDSADGDYIWSRDAAQRKIMLKIKEKRPDAIFEAFSNSAPYYMTNSGCVGGSQLGLTDNLNPKYYEAFAHYLVDVCKHYRDEYGIEFRTLEPFNEPYTYYWKRNGDQEGCRFSYESQIAFLKVLYPILKASGLRTEIAVSDETSVSTSVNGFKKYEAAGVLGMVGQWNTHSYSGSNQDRAELNALAKSAGKRLWMSETGASGDGIKGNLDMARRMMDDVRYLECVSWHDWQYIEEGNDQWCLVRADFANQTSERVKNYYVRQQVTRFIKPGYQFVDTGEDNALAAISQGRDTLVVVALNGGNIRKTHEFRLKNCEAKGVPMLYFTSVSANMMKSACSYDDGVVSYTVPDQSIATFVIPLKRGDNSAVESVSRVPLSLSVGRNELSVSGEGRCNVAVYGVGGMCCANVDFDGSVTLPLSAGYYVVRVSSGDDVIARTVRVE
ncbi:MAG: glycoside hydrolase [Bacteroidales bacterium]|nr:glycoside hydrolase [Bacteroidales bacterium]